METELENLLQNSEPEERELILDESCLIVGCPSSTNRLKMLMSMVDDFESGIFSYYVYKDGNIEEIAKNKSFDKGCYFSLLSLFTIGKTGSDLKMYWGGKVLSDDYYLPVILGLD